MSQSEPKACFVALDLGGTWIKGVAAPPKMEPQKLVALEVARIRNPGAECSSGTEFAAALVAFCRQLAGGSAIQGIVASTAGSVDGSGKTYRVAAEHLGIMGTNSWREEVEAELGCEFWLHNDAEAFLLGVASTDGLPRAGAVAGMVIGTGLGFALVRDGRWWRPGRELAFLGAIHTQAGTFDEWSSATAAAAKAGGDLLRFLTDPAFEAEREIYWDGLRRILAGAAILFQLEEVILGGGLVAACQAADIDLVTHLSADQEALYPPGLGSPRIRSANPGNGLALVGGLVLAEGNFRAGSARFRNSFACLETENGPGTEPIDSFPAEEIVSRLMKAELQAAESLVVEEAHIAAVAKRMAESLRMGGRIISVGAGTSGRIAALDAIEIPCTYGEDPSRFVAVIAGGVADSLLTVESDCEEDHSAVGDLILLQPRPGDMVIGISASGTAFFVRSALHYARFCGAYTVLIHEAGIDGVPFFDQALCLHSGAEVVAGSTRMKAGTATKKILNMLSTTAEILLGRVRGGRMIDLEVSNDKSHHRAEGILAELGRMSLEEAREKLRRHGYRLREALDEESSQTPPRRI